MTSCWLMIIHQVFFSTVALSMCFSCWPHWYPCWCMKDSIHAFILILRKLCCWMNQIKVNRRRLISVATNAALWCHFSYVVHEYRHITAGSIRYNLIYNCEEVLFSQHIHHRQHTPLYGGDFHPKKSVLSKTLFSPTATMTLLNWQKYNTFSITSHRFKETTL